MQNNARTTYKKFRGFSRFNKKKYRLPNKVHTTTLLNILLEIWNELFSLCLALYQYPPTTPPSPTPTPIWTRSITVQRGKDAIIQNKNVIDINNNRLNIMGGVHVIVVDPPGSDLGNKKSISFLCWNKNKWPARRKRQKYSPFLFVNFFFTKNTYLLLCFVNPTTEHRV